MSDVAIVMGREGGDLVLEGGDLRADPGLGSALLLSLFSDGRAPDATQLEGDDVRGWWAEGGEQYGSLLWTIDREKTTTELLARVREHAESALRWVVDEGYAERVEVAASYPSLGHLLLEVRLVRGSATRGASLWAATSSYQVPFGTSLLDLTTV